MVKVLVLFFISLNLFGAQDLFKCRMGNAKLKQEIFLRGTFDQDDHRGMIKMVIHRGGQEVELKRLEVVGISTFFEGGEISEAPFSHLRLQPQEASAVLYFNFLVGYPDPGSSHFVTEDNILFRGNCFSL